MSTITRINTGPRMSATVIHNGIAYLAGQTAAGNEDVKEQAKAVLAKVDALLHEAGTDKTRLLSATIFLRDIDNDFASFNEIWDAWVAPGNTPARACVEARMSKPNCLCEVCVIAAVGA